MPSAPLATSHPGSAKKQGIMPAISTDAVLSCSASLQLKRNDTTLAKSTTQEEFEDNMHIITALATLQHGVTGQKPYFCYDNNKIQQQARFRRMGMRRSQKVWIPVHSPDFNKPIEHVFNYIKEQLRQRIYDHVGPVSAAELQQWVVQIFNGIDTSSIARDVASLKRTYKAVATGLGEVADVQGGGKVKGTGGGWPAPHDA